MAELYFYPDSESAPHRDKPKGAYIKFLKRKRKHFGSRRGENDPEFVEVDEPCYFPISVAPNIESIDNFRKTGAKVIGFGNFPPKTPFGEIRRHLLENTELMFDNPDNAMRKHLEAKVREEIEAEARAEAAAISVGAATENPAAVTGRKRRSVNGGEAERSEVSV